MPAASRGCKCLLLGCHGFLPNVDLQRTAASDGTLKGFVERSFCFSRMSGEYRPIAKPITMATAIIMRTLRFEWMEGPSLVGRLRLRDHFPFGPSCFLVSPNFFLSQS
jgi:hypothetical protein